MPSASLPSVIGMLSDEPKKQAFTCAGYETLEIIVIVLLMFQIVLLIWERESEKFFKKVFLNIYERHAHYN